MWLILEIIELRTPLNKHTHFLNIYVLISPNLNDISCFWLGDNNKVSTFTMQRLYEGAFIKYVFVS